MRVSTYTTWEGRLFVTIASRFHNGTEVTIEFGSRADAVVLLKALRKRKRRVVR